MLQLASSSCDWILATQLHWIGELRYLRLLNLSILMDLLSSFEVWLLGTFPLPSHSSHGLPVASVVCLHRPLGGASHRLASCPPFAVSVSLVVVIRSWSVFGLVSTLPVYPCAVERSFPSCLSAAPLYLCLQCDALLTASAWSLNSLLVGSKSLHYYYTFGLGSYSVRSVICIDSK